MVDIIIYGAFVAGFLGARRISLPKVQSASIAFSMLETSLKKAFPDLSEGFTWREGVERAMKAEFDVDWRQVEFEVDQYEGYRYGGSELPTRERYEVVRLAAFLKRRRKIGI